MDEQEKNIILDCQSGNIERFSELYNLYIGKIYKFIYFKTLHKQTAEDLTSEVFFKALKNINKFSTKYRFSPWIYKIAHNTVIDYFRTYKKTENIEDVWGLADDTDFVEKIEEKMVFEKVQKYLAGFSNIEREIIIMRLWQDMSYDEISEVVGKSSGNCKVIFSRSISKLRSEVLLAALILLILHI